MTGAFKSEIEETTIMGFTVDGFNRAKSKMLSDFNKAIADAEELRKAETAVSDEGSATARATVEEKSGGAGASLAGASLKMCLRRPGKCGWRTRPC